MTDIQEQPASSKVGRHHNPDAEKSLIATAINNNATIDEVAEIIDADSFGAWANGEFWRIINEIRSLGAVVDVPAILEHVGEERIADLGGKEYLFSILPMAGTSQSAKTNAKIIRRHAITRQVIATCQEIIDDADSRSMKPEELLDTMERKVFALTQTGRSAGSVVSNSIVVDESLALLEKRVDIFRTGAASGSMSYGLRDLDQMTAGIHAGELVIVGARPGVGKTILGCHLADVASCGKHTALFVSLEQARFELELRLLSKHSMVSSFKMRNGALNDNEVDNITSAAARVRHNPLWWDDTFSQTVGQIASKARRLKAKHDLKILVVDYVQLIEAANRRQKRHEQVGEMTRSLKRLARELNICVVAMAQLNRENEKRGGEPKLADLREAGSIEQDADTVILLHNPTPPNEDLPAALLKLIVAKQRNGPICGVLVVHDKLHYALCNYEKDIHAGLNA